MFYSNAEQFIIDIFYYNLKIFFANKYVALLCIKIILLDMIKITNKH
jgi:hypothetical protein